MIKANSTVLFQGDSVTDAGRTGGYGNGLGDGFPFAVNEFFQNEHPEMNIKVINRGISGNRSRDLAARWEKDCIALKPDYVTILIGVNDTWRRYDDNDPTPDEDYEKNLRDIIERTKAGTSAKIMLLMPFIVDGVSEEKTKMREDLKGKQAVVKKLAAEYGTLLVDLDKILAERIKAGTKPQFISADGVHPTDDGGHRIIAEEWLKIDW